MPPHLVHFILKCLVQSVGSGWDKEESVSFMKQEQEEVAVDVDTIPIVFLRSKDTLVDKRFKTMKASD